jgi:hypothetical protein
VPSARNSRGLTWSIPTALPSEVRRIALNTSSQEEKRHSAGSTS